LLPNAPIYFDFPANEKWGRFRSSCTGEAPKIAAAELEGNLETLGDNKAGETITN